MTLILFWIKILATRALSLLKTSPATIALALIFIGAFIFAFANNYIELAFDIHTIIPVVTLLVFFSLFRSIKNYNVMPVLVQHSKSKYRNRMICIRYFIKQAVKNNLLLLIFFIVSYNSLPNKNHFAALSGFFIISLILSFLIMYLKNSFTGRKMTKSNTAKPKVNPLIKSTLYDYSALLPAAILCAALCLFMIFLIFGEILFHIKIESQYTFFTLITVFFFIGFLGVIESVPNINWKYQAIISPNDYKYHFKRTVFLFAGLFGPVLVLFMIVGGIINFPLLLKHLYCILVFMLITINIAFTTTHVLLKMMVLILAAVLTLWISSLPTVFLPVLAIPVFIAFLKAKDDYREWSLS